MVVGMKGRFAGSGAGFRTPASAARGADVRTGAALSAGDALGSAAADPDGTGKELDASGGAIACFRDLVRCGY